MKISLNSVKEIPDHLDKEGLCIYGKPTEEILSWADFHGISIEEEEKFTNFILPNTFKVENAFHLPPSFDYLDGFSPNLNKKLHLGHLSNFIIAKSFLSLGVARFAIAQLGDTLEGLNKEDCLNDYINLTKEFEYQILDIYFASSWKEQDLSKPLFSGEGEYEGAKVFKLPSGKQIVGIKTNGSTTYFFQDVALASRLDSKSILYLTGAEQKEHFEDLSEFFNPIEHKPLGLVTLRGQKMSSRQGNVIFLDEIFEKMTELLGDDRKLIWNVLAGHILKSSPETGKKIDLDTISNPKASIGLYLSYTLAKLKSAGLPIKTKYEFNQQLLTYNYYKAKQLLSPNILLQVLEKTAHKLSLLYNQYQIKDNLKNQAYFTPLAEDLLLGMKKIGMFEIERV